MATLLKTILPAKHLTKSTSFLGRISAPVSGRRDFMRDAQARRAVTAGLRLSWDAFGVVLQGSTKDQQKSFSAADGLGYSLKAAATCAHRPRPRPPRRRRRRSSPAHTRAQADPCWQPDRSARNGFSPENRLREPVFKAGCHRRVRHPRPSRPLTEQVRALRGKGALVSCREEEEDLAVPRQLLLQHSPNCTWTKHL